MGKSDPYLEFSRQMPDGKFVAVHRTEVFTFLRLLSTHTLALTNGFFRCEIQGCTEMNISVLHHPVASLPSVL